MTDMYQPQVMPVPSKWDQMLQYATEQGIMSTSKAINEPVPWPTLMLTLLGSLATAALLLTSLAFFIYLMGVSSIESFYFFSIGFIASALYVLCISKKTSLFIETFMFVILVCGLLLLGILLGFETLSGGMEWVIFFMACLVMICACFLPAAWMKQLGGFTGAILFYLSIYIHEQFWGGGDILYYLQTFILPLIAAIGIFSQIALKNKASWGLVLRIEPLLSGWLVATFLLLAYGAGASIFFGYFMPYSSSVNDTHWMLEQQGLLLQSFKTPFAWISVVSLLLAYLWARIQEPLFKTRSMLVLCFVVILFSWLQAYLALCLALTILVFVTQRYRIALLGGVCALWVVGSLYYSMSMPLTIKAACLAITGMMLLGIAFMGKVQKPRNEQDGEQDAQHVDDQAVEQGQGKTSQTFAHKPWVNTVLIVAAALFSFGGINVSIWQQEGIRSEGVEVLIPLAPVDPRSIMQGDYMDLRFSLPEHAEESANGVTYIHIDENGVGHFIESAQEGSIAFNLKKKGGYYTVPVDAWFFEEGDAKRWEAARFGIFKVDGSGRSSLIGMADEGRHKILSNDQVH